MKKEKQRLLIDLLVLHKDKAFGFQQYILNILDYFYLHREEIKYKDIVLLCKDDELNLLSKYADKFEVRCFHVTNYIYRLLLQSLLPFVCKFSNEDLLFTPGNVSGLIKKCPEILVVHDLLFKHKEWIPNRLMRWQRELFFPLSIKKADKVVAISNFTSNDIADHYPFAKEKVGVIYNYMNFGKYDCCETSLFVPNSFFLAISTNAPYKNQQTILNAFKIYCNAGGKKKLVFVGTFSSESEAGRVFNILPNNVREKIIFKTRISNSELGMLYQNASCFISASLFEGFGMPVVEAMSFGLPVLLSDIPPHREVSLNKGEFFEPTDVGGLAEKMLCLCFDKKGYDKDIRDMYSEANTSAKYVELINQMYSNNH